MPSKKANIKLEIMKENPVSLKVYQCFALLNPTLFSTPTFIIIKKKHVPNHNLLHITVKWFYVFSLHFNRLSEKSSGFCNIVTAFFLIFRCRANICYLHLLFTKTLPLLQCHVSNCFILYIHTVNNLQKKYIRHWYNNILKALNSCWEKDITHLKNLNVNFTRFNNFYSCFCKIKFREKNNLDGRFPSKHLFRHGLAVVWKKLNLFMWK